MVRKATQIPTFILNIDLLDLYDFFDYLEVILSEHYQVAIPEEIRNLLHLKAGQVFSIAIKDNSISLAPKSTIGAFRGILKGANINDIRDRKDRT